MTNKERDEKVWQKFILLLSVESFTEKEVIEGKIQMNLFGSVEHHKKVFMEATRQIDIEAAIAK